MMVFLNVMPRRTLILFGLALFFLLIAIILFYLLHIPRVFGELTGYSNRKEVNKMSRSNRFSEALSRRLQKPATGETGQASADRASAGQAKTARPGSAEQTVLLPRNQAAADGGNETTLLDSGQTTLLSQNENAEEAAFSVQYSLSFIESDEIIE